MAKNYELVFWGEGNYDADKVVKDLTALSGQAKAIWDDYPLIVMCIWCMPPAAPVARQNI